MIELIYKYEATLRLSAFLGGFGLLALVEWLLPKRKLTQEKLKRWLNNMALVITGTVLVRLLIPTAAIATAYMVEQHQWGMMYHNHVEMPYWLTVVVCFIFLDLSIYFQHAMFHVLPFMWRFHRIHHNDLDCDVTTGLRFHPVEILLSMLIKLTTIMMLGAPVLAVILFEVGLNLMSMFTHANIRLNKTFERVLRWFVVTPDMHRVHHSTRENETNSNFAFNISLWDRIFGTYMAQPEAGHQGMTIGLDRFREPDWQGFSGLLRMPFAPHVGGYAINYRDTKNEDELALARKLAQESEEKARLASELASYMQAINQHALVSVTDRAGKIIQANDTFCKVSGYSKDELIGQNHRLISSGAHSKKFYKTMWEIIAKGNVWRGEICNRAKGGGLYWVDGTIVPLKDEHDEIEGYVSVRIDITDRKQDEAELRELNQELEKLCRVDSLTKIANRRCLDESIQNEISRMRRENSPLTIVMCDIDFFKNYNDAYGHQKGDACLQQVAEMINSCFSRAGDLVARYGGEEFAVILPNADQAHALLVGERARARVLELGIEHQSSEISDVVSISVGVTSVVPDGKTTVDSLIGQADKALYAAKAKGRNNVQLFE